MKSMNRQIWERGVCTGIGIYSGKYSIALTEENHVLLGTNTYVTHREEHSPCDRVGYTDTQEVGLELYSLHK